MKDDRKNDAEDTLSSCNIFFHHPTVSSQPVVVRGDYHARYSRIQVLIHIDILYLVIKCNIHTDLILSLFSIYFQTSLFVRFLFLLLYSCLSSSSSHFSLSHPSPPLHIFILQHLYTAGANGTKERSHAVNLIIYKCIERER